jgi:hypothetical protein
MTKDNHATVMAIARVGADAVSVAIEEVTAL